MPNPINSIPKLDPNQLLTNPARTLAGPVKWNAVTYDADFGAFSEWIYVGTTGNVSVTQWDGTTVTIPNLTGGIMHWLPATKINTSGTTVAANQLFWGS
jgi:hypothetical protein